MESSSPHKKYNLPTSRDQRLAIQTAPLFKVPNAEIQSKLNVTRGQISYARNHPTTPQKNKAGRPLLRTPTRNYLQHWLQLSPSHARIPWRSIPARAPELQLDGVGEKAMKTAFRQLGYVRRTAKRKGVLEDPRVKQLRYQFALEAVNWSRQRVGNQIFSDEVWANGGAHTTSYVTAKEDESDRYLESNVQHKYSKAPAWMFHGTI